MARIKKEEMKKQPWFPAVKVAQRALIKAVGGIESAADLLGLSSTQVGRYNNSNDPDLMALWEIVVLEDAIGKAVLSRALAMRVGSIVVDSSGPDFGDGGDLSENAMSLTASHAKWWLGFLEAAEDHVFTNSEKLGLLPMLQSVIQTASTMERNIMKELGAALAKADGEKR
ncbi:hypothetical protein FB480_103434 [Agrobacterium vitis]|nr:hypothetical protein FB480_103434 [Agrobacterium vitis]